MSPVRSRQSRAAEGTAALLAWYDAHRRDLPWRRTADPYAIWISEIMLQQTRVAAVLEHYARWMKRFPDVATLAAAQEAEVLTLWSGLGYYRRARMLHKAAQTLVCTSGGMLPRTAAALRALPGIGEYTSAAIASIAFGEAVAVVDGNVERIITRVQALVPARALAGADASAATRSDLARDIRTGAASLVDPRRPGDTNQAMMELGATVCLPRAPLCLHCPLQPWCLTRGEHVTPKRAKPIQRQIAYALVVDPASGGVLLQQRAHDASLMAGMWELPELAQRPAEPEVAVRLRHAITVTAYAVEIIRLHRLPEADKRGGLQWFAMQALGTLPLTGLARKALRRLHYLESSSGTQ